MAETERFIAVVDRDLLKRAKAIAARSNTSVTALFIAELRRLVELFESGEMSGNQNFKILLDFSLGRIDCREALDALGFDSEEDLFLLMAHVHLPMPRLPDSVTREMVNSLQTLVR